MAKKIKKIKKIKKKVLKSASQNVVIGEYADYISLSDCVNESVSESSPYVRYRFIHTLC